MPGQPANAVCAGHRAACSGLRESLTAALSLQRARIVRRRCLKAFRAFQPFRLADDSGALAGVETSSLRSSVWQLLRQTQCVASAASAGLVFHQDFPAHQIADVAQRGVLRALRQLRPF